MTDTSNNSVNLKTITCNLHGDNQGEYTTRDVMVSDDNSFNIFSHNLHGLNQGNPAIAEIISDFSPDIVFDQEHWFTPDNLVKLRVRVNS
jgi:hypothetical protein